jgi:hypothetical protein
MGPSLNVEINIIPYFALVLTMLGWAFTYGLNKGEIKGVKEKIKNHDAMCNDITAILKDVEWIKRDLDKHKPD